MQINHVQIFLSTKEATPLNAAANITLNSCLLLKNISIRPNEKDPSHPRIYLPMHWLPDQSIRCFYHLATREALERYICCIREAYLHALQNPEQRTTTFEEKSREDFQVTDAAIEPYLSSTGPVFAKVSLELDRELWLREMLLVARQKDGKLYLRMPQRKLKNGKWVSYYHPFKRDARVTLTQAILPRYKESLQKAGIPDADIAGIADAAGVESEEESESETPGTG